VSEATQALHEIASEAEIAEVRAEIAEEGAEIAEQRAEAAEQMAAEIFAASLETDHGRRITALEERIDAWLSSTKSSSELSEELSQIKTELALLTTQVNSQTATLLTPPQLEQPTVTPELETPPSVEAAQEKKEAQAEKPKKGSRAKARWI
jgi:hypothetical protein